MKLIELTQGFWAKIDDGDYELISQFKWHVRKRRDRLYAGSNVFDANLNKYHSVYMHRLLLGDGDYITDHKDHDGLNNTRENIRKCSIAENNRNTRVSKNKQSSLYKGVYRIANSDKWKSCIMIDGKELYLGVFNSEKKAAENYDESAKKHFGNFACLNFQ